MSQSKLDRTTDTTTESPTRIKKKVHSFSHVLFDFAVQHWIIHCPTCRSKISRRWSSTSALMLRIVGVEFWSMTLGQKRSDVKMNQICGIYFKINLGIIFPLKKDLNKYLQSCLRYNHFLSLSVYNFITLSLSFKMCYCPYTAFSSIRPGRSVRSSTLSHWVAPAAMTPLLGKKLTSGSPLYCTRNAPSVECIHTHECNFVWWLKNWSWTSECIFIGQIFVSYIQPIFLVE